jgi:hypothetical protein
MLLWVNKYLIAKIRCGEPPTKQFHSKCQSSRDLLSSQSAWSIATPSCVGWRPASRQSIRDGHLERQAVSGASSTTRTRNKWEPACIEKLRVSASRLVLPTVRAFTSRHGHQARPAQPSRRASAALPSTNGLHSVQCSDGLHLARTSYEQRPFQGLPQTFGVWRAWSHVIGNESNA